ncbi:MAG: ribonuclease R [Nitrospirae bacterium]|nr:ribonuclease R [Nitrospirota bacterium]MCL5237620.1 ribonuclease R [Nitrospirota bacterium]
MITKDSLIALFREKITKPVSFNGIVFMLNLSPPERRKLKKILREMVSGGDIVRTRKGLYGPAEEMSLVTGFFEAHKDGYGFVVLEKPGERDIFIPAKATSGAMDNDRVIARVENRQRREGRIIRILERAHTRIMGTLEVNRTVFSVKPKNKFVPFSLYIAPKDRGKAKEGDTVIAEVVSYPTDKRPPAGRVIKVLKKPGSPVDEVEGIIDEFNLPGKFPHDVTGEADRLYEKARSAGHRDKKRKDLRNLATVTIDGERARDFDDAVSIEKAGEVYRLWVHIADVGYYIKGDSPIDLEARKRGTSVYFPDRVIPMLPKELSEDLCSLKPGVERLSFTVEMEFDRHGKRLCAKFYPSLIKSNERMTYTSVRKILVDRDSEERARYEYLLNDFELMGELCNVLKTGRLRRGSLDFDLPEPEVLLDVQGNPEAIIKAERNFAHMIIEEFMIAANEAVAGRLEGLDVPSLYRVHEEPDPMKLEYLMKVINNLGVLKNRKTVRPKDFSDLLKQIAGSPEEEIVHHIILRSLKQARYSPINVGHFGLASESYTHFTSPIRRYPDLVVHRILRTVVAGGRLTDKRTRELDSTLPDIAFHSSMTERRADEAERAVLGAMRVWFMRDKVGEVFEGRVVKVMPYGLKVRLKDYYVEGLLHVSYMTDDFYQYDEKDLSLSGLNKKKRFSIGKKMNVRIERVDMEEREIILGL